jgi:hypothetical protein
MAKTDKTYYAGVKIGDKEAQIYTSRVGLARYVGVHEVTIKRQLLASNPYFSRRYIIFSSDIEKIDGRGWDGFGKG